MKIQTEIRRDDYNAFLKFIRTKRVRPRMGYLWPLGICLGILGGILLEKLFPPGDDDTFFLILIGFILGVAFLYLFAILVARSQRKRLSPTDDCYFFGHQEVEIQTDGIHVKSLHHQSHYQWSLVDSPYTTNEHLFIMIDRIAGIIIPRRSFPSEAECNAFLEAIQTRKQRTQSFWPT